MKTLRRLTIWSAALLAFCVLHSAQAQNADEKLFQELDVSEDGQLSGRELDKGDARKYDANGDGRVTREEFLKGRNKERHGAQPDLLTPNRAAATLNHLRLMPPVGHTDFLRGLAFSPNGKLAISASEDSTLRLWEVATRREVRVFSGHASDVYCVAFSPHGGTVLSGGLDETARLWDTATGQEVRCFKLPGFSTQVAYTADGQQVAALSSGVRFWNVVDGQPQTIISDSEARSFAISPDGAAVLCGGSGAIRLWDVKTGRKIRDFAYQPEGNVVNPFVSSVTFSPDGKTALSGGADKTVRLWDVATGRELRRFAGHTGGVEEVIYFPTGTHALSAGQDRMVRLWDVATGKSLGAINGAPELFLTMALSPNGNTLLVAFSDSSVRVIDLTTAQVVGVLRQREAQAAYHLALSPNQKHLLVALGWGGLTEAECVMVLRDMATGREVQRFPNTIFPAKFLAGGAHIVAYRPPASGKFFDEGAFIILDAGNGREIRRFPAYSNCLAISPDGRLLLALGADGAVRLWDVATGQLVRSFKHPGDRPDNAVFSTDGRLITTTCRTSFALGGPQELVGLWQWETATGREVRRHSLPLHASALLNSTGTQALLSARDKNPVLLDVTTGREVRALEGFIGPAQGDMRTARAVEWSADGRFLAASIGDEHEARIWEIASGREVRRLQGHSNSISGLIWSVDGKSIVSSGNDHTLRLWETATGRPLLTLLNLTGGDWLVFTPDGRFDGSPGGMAKVHFARGLETFAVEQFAERFYTPGLASLVAGTAKPAATIEQNLLAGAPPEVKIISPALGVAGAAQIEVAVQASERNGGGVKAIRLYHNGRLAGGPGALRGIVLEEAAPQGNALIKRFTVQLLPGANELRAVAYSRADIESAPAQVVVQWKQPEPERPTLHVLAVGINQYRDAAMKLDYARPDAEAIARFFGDRAQMSLFREVKLTALYDAQATGAAIRAALQNIAAQAREGDVVFLYFAGHGAALDEKDGATPFYFLPHDVAGMALPQQVRDGGVSGQDIAALLAQMKAQRVVLVYDACQSGAAIQGGLAGLGSDRQALAVLARAQGIHILTASTSTQAAQENAALGHGILTYALLEGLHGKATEEKSVMVRELTGYVERSVRRLITENNLSRQVPMPFNWGQNFALAGKP